MDESCEISRREAGAVEGTVVRGGQQMIDLDRPGIQWAARGKQRMRYHFATSMKASSLACLLGLHPNLDGNSACFLEFHLGPPGGPAWLHSTKMTEGQMQGASQSNFDKER